VLLIAGGICITPLRALLEVLPVRRGDMALLYRAPTNASVVFKKELNRIAEVRGARVDLVTGSRDQFTFNDDPLSPGGLWAAYPDIRERDIYLCGSPRMMATVEKSLRDIGVSHSQIHLERFSW
jgi:ferredoxin-NADP reductase